MKFEEFSPLRTAF